ncbi:hypothetical protein [Staphylococcus xylosus]|uniref:hypothetical protein n=1 Tax=Staphylococcus xylosus TaxID=1288 RepID=UPI003F55EBB1
MYNVIFGMKNSEKQYYIKSKFKHSETILNELIQEYDIFLFDDEEILNCSEIESVIVSKNIYLSGHTRPLKQYSGMGWKYGVITFR